MQMQSFNRSNDKELTEAINEWLRMNPTKTIRFVKQSHHRVKNYRVFWITIWYND